MSDFAKAVRSAVKEIAEREGIPYEEALNRFMSTKRTSEFKEEDTKDTTKD